MVTSHLNFAIAADSESGDSGGDDKKDSGSKDDGGGDDKKESSKDSGDDKKDSGDDDKQQNKEGSDSNDNQDTQLSSSNDDNDKPSGDAIIKSTPPTSTPPTSTPPTEEEKEKEKAESDVQQQDSADINDNSNSKPYYEKDAGDAIISDKPSKQQYEDEKAAIEDYIYDEPGKVKPYSTEGVKEPWKIKLIESLNAEAEQQNKPQEQEKQQRHRTEETEQQGNDPCNYFGKNICEGSKDGKTCNEEKFDCLSDTKDKDGNWNYCTTGKCPGDDKPYDKPPHGPEYCHNCGDDGKGKGKGDKGKDWWNQEGKHEHDYDDGHDHHDHNHHHHSNYCDYHNCHEHHHHSEYTLQRLT